MNFKDALKLVVKILILTIVMFISVTIASKIVPLTLEQLSAEESKYLLPTLLMVYFLSILVVSYPIVHSRWYGWRLILTMIAVFFVIRDFQSQIEVCFFRSAFEIPIDMQFRMILQSLISLIIFTPAAVLLLGKMKRDKAEGESNLQFDMRGGEWVWRLLLLSLIFACIYFLCGNFIAMQSSAVREFYEGHLDISTGYLFLLQIGRGLVWILIALPVIKMMNGKKWENALILGCMFAVIHSVQIVIPNPLMPTAVRMVHLVELLVSLFSFGFIIGLFINVHETSEG